MAKHHQGYVDNLNKGLPVPSMKVKRWSNWLQPRAVSVRPYATTVAATGTTVSSGKPYAEMRVERLLENWPM